MLQIIYGTHMKLKFKLKNKQKHRSKLRKGQRLKTHYEGANFFLTCIFF